MNNGAMAVKEKEQRATKRICVMDLEDLSLDWDGVDQCRNIGLGALRLYVDTLRNMIEGVGGDEEERLHLLVWMMKGQIEKIDSFLERLFEAMRIKNIKLEG
ncbi:MAG: hypothetical protein ABH969_10050 [Pseudomonadota bacterium]